ncbi:MAG: hypothetical protein HN742_22575 [Lentisphaerae bacterium]|jgi:hypothetical protein|nr:hypothetical protein [Lentisphaerota bacterium]MBT4818051.1 hypothetical protein [Lentisphaerota bacterium]MBT5605021.1 hypothetical protein [Lentisphaerota bacterium]MBT7054651.1 hypothetical protein [Lentisphaerota bacterium]MBT7844680.1 hypothetical protein [Lentisphaerota bacterium]
MDVPIPQIAAPNYWLADAQSVWRYLSTQLVRGRLKQIGTSSLGHPLHVVEYGPESGRPLMVIGGTHGHEPGTVAAAMNLIHCLEQGRDLAGHPQRRLLGALEDIRLCVLPMLNPDGRLVCPLSFHAQGIDTCTIYACGLQNNGDLVPYDADSQEPCYHFPPKKCLFMGGQFNGAGYAINRRRSTEASSAVEVAAALDFTLDRRPEAILDLHACGYNFAFQARSHEAPYWPVMREWQQRAEGLFRVKGRVLKPLHGDGDPPTPPLFHFNSSLFHRHGHLMWIAFEGRQGYLGRSSFMPLPTHWEIVDDYLSAVTVFSELGHEGHYEEANRAVFGPT